MDDLQLIESILQGNQKDFERLVTAYSPAVFRVVIGLVHNKEDAEEVTQDVFVNVYHSLSAFHKKSAFSTWLYRLAINTALNFLRKKRRRGFWTGITARFSFPSNEPSADSRITGRSEFVLIQQAINTLPQKQRLAFVLTKYEELPQKEVAAIMGITEGAVEQLVARAKNNLRKKLQQAIG